MTDYSTEIAALKRERGALASTPGNGKRLRSVDAQIAKLRAARAGRHGRVSQPVGVETADQDHSRTETAAAHDGEHYTAARKRAARKRAARGTKSG